jgi:hypothetical protein
MVAMMNQVARDLAGPEGLLQRIQGQVGAHGSRRPPADDHPCENIDDEGDVDEAGPRRDIGEIGDPELVWPVRMEHPADEIHGPLVVIGCHRGALGLAPDNAMEAHGTHQTLDRAGATRWPSRASWRHTLRAP